MLRQFSFVPAIGKLCRVSSTSTHLSVIISLCRSGYSWRINNKCFSRLSTKCHSTNKFRLLFDKKKRSRKKYFPPLKVQEEENQSLADQELDQEQHHGSLNQSKAEKEEENQSLANPELDQEQHHGSLNQSKAEKLDWDPFEDLFGVGIDMEPRNITFSRPEPRSWIGPNGQYVKELPCPSCRGRGYMLCTECGIHCSRPSCPQCHGKGLSTCRECLGECVIWEESVDELPWEKAYTSSPINIGEDDAIDKMEIGSTPKRKSKRVYAPTPPDVGAKISRTLKNLNAVTGMFSKKMKKVHSDPILRAQTVEAMKRAKRTPEARQHASNMMTTFFSNPENRLKRSISMKGVKFYCRNCGEEGHRSHYCPSLKDKIGPMRYKCRRCGKTGHNRTTCKQKRKHKSHRRTYNCSVCGQGGHNSKTCPQKDQANGFGSKHQNQELLNNVNIIKRQTIKCSICCEPGHNARSCSRRVKLQNTKAQTNLLK